MTSAVTRRALFGLSASSLAVLAGVIPDASLAARRAGLGYRTPVLRQDSLAGPMTLPELTYATDALEPHIDTMTMEIHHGKHHQAYIDNLNKLVTEHPEIADLSPSDVLADLTLIPEEIRTGVRNNLGGHVNHSMFWNLMTPESTQPGAELAAAIARDFGSIEDMQAAVNEAGLKRFGSGWTWVVMNGGVLSVVSTPNQDNPVMDELGVPVLGIDVWEHAYYLAYQNRRADYLTAWWNIVNWSTVDQAFLAAVASQ